MFRPLLFCFCFFIIKCRMVKVKTLIFEFKNSLLPHHPFYGKVVRSPFAHALRYFLLLLTCLNVLWLAYGVLRFPPGHFAKTLSQLEKSLSQIPADFVATVSSGALVSNHGRPYFLWLTEGSAKHLLAVVDESAEPAKIYEYRALALLSGRTLTIWPAKSTTAIHTFPLSLLGDRSFSKVEASSFTKTLTYFRNALWVAYLAGALVLFVLLLGTSIAINLFSVAFLSLLVTVFYRFFLPGKRVRYDSTLKVGLHAATVPLLIDYGLNVFAVRPPNMYLLFIFILLVFIGAGVYEAVWVKGKD